MRGDVAHAARWMGHLCELDHKMIKGLELESIVFAHLTRVQEHPTAASTSKSLEGAQVKPGVQQFSVPLALNDHWPALLWREHTHLHLRRRTASSVQQVSAKLPLDGLATLPRPTGRLTAPPA